MNNGGISLDKANELLSQILDISKELNIGKITSISFKQEQTGYIIEVKADDKLYYMLTSSYGYIEAVKKDSLDGEIVYMPMDD